MIGGEDLALWVFVMCMVALAVIGGSLIGRYFMRYHAWAWRQRRERKARVRAGTCPRCGRAPMEGSVYCSERHELDDAYNDAGY